MSWISEEELIISVPGSDRLSRAVILRLAILAMNASGCFLLRAVRLIVLKAMDLAIP